MNCYSVSMIINTRRTKLILLFFCNFNGVSFCEVINVYKSLHSTVFVNVKDIQH